MDPRRFLAQALRMLEEKSPEGCRSAVSRAYNVAVEFLESLNLSVPKGPGGHGEVQHRLSNSGDPELAQAAYDLSNHQSDRIKADYRLKDPAPENLKTAQALVDRASRIILVMDECRRSKERRAQIETGVRRYLGLDNR